ncbi:MAG: Histone acetyltransferase [Peltula sp. TS41687]|nr:MAG: Histone acetyltransferase [Peltula sp. TS41687]
MAKKDSSPGRNTPDPVGEKGFATLATLQIGVKAFVEKITSVHYEEFNKRLDEWIPSSRIDLSREVEWPAPEKPEKKKAPTAPNRAGGKLDVKKVPKGQKRPRPRASSPNEAPLTTEVASANLPGKPPQPTLAGGKENSNNDSIAIVQTEVTDGTYKPEDEEMDVEEAQDAAAAAKASAPELYSREEEIEKLRTSGSMTQNQTEISRVRNLSRIQMGQFEMEPWYFSPYPIEFTEEDEIYICEFCLSYHGEERQFERHRQKCTLLHPPGNEIYRDDYVSFFEVDGRRQRTWCRNLCLLSKLFLDHKTLYYDVDPFLFYCMTTRDQHGCHLVGYFSKEKESAEGYNVACILTLPQYQRKGFGRLLIAFSYELSKREGRHGSPEKPLSDLGLLGYRAYWQETIVDLLLQDTRTEVTVDELAALTSMTSNDVLHTLQNLNMMRYNKGQHVIVLTNAILEQKNKMREKEKLKGGRRRIDPERLQWKPPVFSAASRTWNW